MDVLGFPLIAGIKNAQKYLGPSGNHMFANGSLRISGMKETMKPFEIMGIPLLTRALRISGNKETIISL